MVAEHGASSLKYCFSLFIWSFILVWILRLNENILALSCGIVWFATLLWRCFAVSVNIWLRWFVSIKSWGIFFRSSATFLKNTCKLFLDSKWMLFLLYFLTIWILQVFWKFEAAFVLNLTQFNTFIPVRRFIIATRDIIINLFFLWDHFLCLMCWNIIAR